MAARGTIVAMTTDSLRNVKDRFSEFVDRVDREHERVVVTRNGRPAAVMISPDDLDSLDDELIELTESAMATRDDAGDEDVWVFCAPATETGCNCSSDASPMLAWPFLGGLLAIGLRRRRR